MFKVYAQPRNTNQSGVRSTRNQKAGGQSLGAPSNTGRGYRGNRTGAGRTRA